MYKCYCEVFYFDSKEKDFKVADVESEVRASSILEAENIVREQISEQFNQNGSRLVSVGVRKIVFEGGFSDPLKQAILNILELEKPITDKGEN